VGAGVGVGDGSGIGVTEGEADGAAAVFARVSFIAANASCPHPGRQKNAAVKRTAAITGTAFLRNLCI